jgi:hypothetical protein
VTRCAALRVLCPALHATTPPWPIRPFTPCESTPLTRRARDAAHSRDASGAGCRGKGRVSQAVASVWQSGGRAASSTATSGWGRCGACTLSGRPSGVPGGVESLPSPPFPPASSAQQSCVSHSIPVQVSVAAVAAGGAAQPQAGTCGPALQVRRQRQARQGAGRPAGCWPRQAAGLQAVDEGAAGGGGEGGLRGREVRGRGRRLVGGCASGAAGSGEASRGRSGSRSGGSVPSAPDGGMVGLRLRLRLRLLLPAIPRLRHAPPLAWPLRRTSWSRRCGWSRGTRALAGRKQGPLLAHRSRPPSDAALPPRCRVFGG